MAIVSADNEAELLLWKLVLFSIQWREAYIETKGGIAYSDGTALMASRGFCVGGEL